MDGEVKGFRFIQSKSHNNNGCNNDNDESQYITYDIIHTHTHALQHTYKNVHAHIGGLLNRTYLKEELQQRISQREGGNSGRRNLGRSIWINEFALRRAFDLYSFLLFLYVSLRFLKSANSIHPLLLYCSFSFLWSSLAARLIH